MNLNFFFGGSHCLSQSVILFLDEIGGWREEGVLFNSARGPNSTNHSALDPAFMACLRGLMENIIKVVQHTFLLTVKKYVYRRRSCFLNRNAPAICPLGYKREAYRE